MSVTTPIFRLRVDSGDTGLSDKKGSAGAMTGSAGQTLIDRGSGEYAMRVSGGQLSISIPSRTIVAGTTGGGFSWAMDIQIENYGTVEYLDLINIGASVIGANATSSSSNGISLERDGANYLNFVKDDTTYSPQMSTGTAKHTIACRLTGNVPGGYWRFDVWLDGTKYTGSLAGYGGDTLSTITINATNGAQFNIRDLPVWAEELPDTDMAALSTGLRATIDGSGTTNGTANGATLTSTASITPGTASGSSAGSTNGAAQGATLTGVGAISAGTASGTTGATGTLTTLPHYRNNTALRANETGVKLNIYNASTGALVLQATGLTTDANGKAIVTNAAIVTGTLYAYETIFTSDSTRRLPTGTAS